MGLHKFIACLIMYAFNFDGSTSQFSHKMEAITCRHIQTTFNNAFVMIYGFLNVILVLINDETTNWYKKSLCNRCLVNTGYLFIASFNMNFVRSSAKHIRKQICPTKS